MKKIINLWPYFVALLPQFFVENYLWLTITLILIGCISKFFLKEKGVFLKMFLLELIVFTIVFFVFGDRVSYLHGILENSGLPSFLLSLLFILFNALNVAILFFTGYTLSSLFIKKTKEITSLKY